MFATRASLTKKRTFTEKERKDLAKSGKALPDGSYPIENGTDLDNAISAVGLGSDPKKEIKDHIIARAKALGLESKIPDKWKSAKKQDKCVDAFASRSMVTKAPYALDQNQTDPFTADTTQVDPSVDSLQEPKPYLSALRPRNLDKLKKAQSYNQTQTMDAVGIRGALTKMF